MIARERVFTVAKLSGLVGQKTVDTPEGRFRVDLWDERSRTAFELDGREFHSDKSAFVADRRRDSALAALGILTVRFTYEDIVSRPDWCREVALRVIRQRERVAGSASPPARTTPHLTRADA